MTLAGTSDGYQDLLDTISTALMWSLVEASVVIIAACLPSTRPLIHRSSASHGSHWQTFDSNKLSKPRGSQLLVHPTIYEFDEIGDSERLTYPPDARR
jgi:hypothetical protein